MSESIKLYGELLLYAIPTHIVVYEESKGLAGYLALVGNLFRSRPAHVMYDTCLGTPLLQ